MEKKLTGCLTRVGSNQKSILPSLYDKGLWLRNDSSPTKPSRPSRAYLYLTKSDYLSLLSDKIRETSFADAKASGGDSGLLRPPSVEFAPYGRVPHSKIRKDARQGTIDQDPEFIDFLESLTNPTVKPTPLEGTTESEVNKGEVVTVTPLIQFLRDKKANKGKEPVPLIKNPKHPRNELKESKTAQASEKKVSPKSAREPPSSPDKRSATAIKVEKAARDAVKVINKQAVTANKVPVVPPTAPPPAPSSSTQPAPSAPAADKRRERGNASVAARILQRDLGLGAGPSNRRRRDAPSAATSTSANSPNAPKTTPPSETSNTPSLSPQVTKSAMVSPASSSSLTPTNASTVKPGPSSIGSQPPTGPAASRPVAKAVGSQVARSPQKPIPAKAASISPTSTQAFLKHANPSQGVTEPLLQEAFAGFGTVDKVEIDKKKGFAYIDFAEPEGLQKAIKASPVKVGQGQVVVLERKTGPSLQARNVRGGGTMGGGRGGGIPMGPRGGRGGSIRGRGGIGRVPPTPPTNVASPNLPASAPTTGNANTVLTTIEDSKKSPASVPSESSTTEVSNMASSQVEPPASAE